MPPAPGLSVFTAAHLAPLRDHLLVRLRDDPLPPRDAETIVVQSQGMRRWLTLQVADALGCAGSLSLPFPATFIYDVANHVLPPPSVDRNDDAFSRDALTWRIDAMLRTLPARGDEWQPLRVYLGAGDDRMRLGLATRIAARFDEYQLYRQDTLLAWERGETVQDPPHARWQASLWRRLCAEAPGPTDHLPRRLTRAIAALRGAGAPALPSRVTVFGVSALPPVFLDLLAALSRTVEVRIYAAVLDDTHAHPLATAFGRQGRELLSLLGDRGAVITRLAMEPDRRRELLPSLQEGIAAPSGMDTVAPSRADRSLAVHDCHGKVRQLEVVRDQLLDALAADPTLRPHDLLLLVPDAGAWAATVDAVFGVATDETPRIPYHLADRSRRSVQPASEAFLRLLALEGGRFARSEVFALLEHPLVRRAADLNEIEVESLRDITARANVHWGYDAASRETLGLPDYETASWRLGLDRLLLGLVTGRADDLVLGALPMAGDTAGDPGIVGLLARWVDRLAATLLSWRRARPVAQWSADLLATTSDFLGATDRRGLQSIRDLEEELRRLAELAAVAHHGDDVPFGVIRDWLETQLGDEGFGAGFLVGGMTVAALKPMRSIPFRVIAVAGLDDEAFPRRDRRAAFDLLGADRRPGDRDLRGDDRQLFLDILLAARDRLILAFGGRAVQDNSPRAPSIVVDELLDHLDRASNGAARDNVVVRHPLQPFSSRYFEGSDPRLFTYSLSQARAAAAGTGAVQPFVPRPVAGTSLGEVSLDELVELWTNPSEYFCRRTLLLSLHGDVADVTDEERVALDKLTQGAVKARILARALAGSRDAKRDELVLENEGLLPPGALARAWHQRLDGDVMQVLDRVPVGPEPHPALISVDDDGWRLTGRLEGIRGDERLVVRAGKMRAEHCIKAWVQHVAMCAAHEAGARDLPTTTRLIGREKKEDLVIPAVQDPRAALASLVAQLASGRSEPLPFFARAGWAWFSAKRAGWESKPRKGSRPKDPVAEAKKAFRKEADRFDVIGGDCEDPYVALCFRDSDPMEGRHAEFERLVQVLFEPWPRPEGKA